MAIRLTARSIPLLAIGVYLAACGSPGTASADVCDLVSARDGSDRAAGTLGAPFKTAQKLIDELEPGQTGCLRAGVYSETPNGPHVARFNRGGRAGSPLTLRSFPSERAKLAGVIYVPEGSDHVHISDLDIDGRGPEVEGKPVSIQLMAKSTVVERTDITNRGLRSCMIIGSNGGHGQARNVVVRRNVFHECGDPSIGHFDHGIYVQNLVGGEITGNVFWGSAAWAVHLYPNADRVKVARNVMDDNYGGVIVASEDEHTSSHNLIESNVISNSGEGDALEISWGGPVGTGNVARSNCLDGTGDAVRSEPGLRLVGNIIAQPRYVDRAKRDYRLARDSPCRSVLDGDPAAELRRTASTTAPAAAVRRVSSTRICRRYRGGSRAARRCVRAAKRARRPALRRARSSS